MIGEWSDVHCFWAEAFNSLSEALQSLIPIVEACDRWQWYVVDLVWIIELLCRGTHWSQAIDSTSSLSYLFRDQDGTRSFNPLITRFASLPTNAHPQIVSKSHFINRNSSVLKGVC